MAQNGLVDRIRLCLLIGGEADVRHFRRPLGAAAERPSDPYDVNEVASLR